uniref:Putative secreted protein n=1 Tax=Anopheles darlingi TaxID=43151 RepID=A0A2M4D3J2_ANODA
MVVLVRAAFPSACHAHTRSRLAAAVAAVADAAIATQAGQHQAVICLFAFWPDIAISFSFTSHCAFAFSPSLASTLAQAKLRFSWCHRPTATFIILVELKDPQSPATTNATKGRRRPLVEARWFHETVP